MHHIFLSLCQKNQYTCEQDALKHLHNYFSELYINRGRNFGNGRDVRNVYEKIISQQMERIVNDGLQGEAMVTITLEDLLAVTSK
jgi:hypothetical protein